MQPLQESDAHLSKWASSPWNENHRWRSLCAWMRLGAGLSGTVMFLVGAPMENRSKVTSQTKGGSPTKMKINQGFQHRPGWRGRDPTLEPGLGLGLAGKPLVMRSALMGLSWVQPKMVTWAQLPIGSPPTGRSMRGRCKVVWMAVVPRGPNDPIFRLNL